MGERERRARGQLSEPALLDVREVAHLLGCCPRNVYRLAATGHMPEPVRLGRLVRWRRAELDAWIADGCQAIGQRRATQ